MWQSILIKLLFTILTILPVVSQCQNPQVRPEIRSLTVAQRTRFFNAIKTMYNGNARNNLFRNFSLVHYNSATTAHGTPLFLPWHRHFLYLFERELKRIDQSVVLPYWDWARDSQSPEVSPIFSDAFFGGNGDPLADNCVRRGTFANWRASVPNNHCLRRRFDAGNQISSWHSTELIERMLNLNRRSYEQFRLALEGPPHGLIHTNIAGDMAQMYSANDPIFYLHHANVDRIWWEWQRRYPSLANTYPTSTAAIMRPFGVTIRSAMNTRLGFYCYTYPTFSGASVAEVTVERMETQRLAARSVGMDDVRNDVMPSINEAFGFTRRQFGFLEKLASTFGGSSAKSKTSKVSEDSEVFEISKPPKAATHSISSKPKSNPVTPESFISMIHDDDDGDDEDEEDDFKLLQFELDDDFVGPLDRVQQFKLNFPKLLPRSHIRMNRLNYKKVRQEELKDYQFLKDFNGLDEGLRMRSIRDLDNVK